MLRRRMLLNQARLPSEYQEVEWIRASGYQYLVLPYVPNTNTEVTCEAYCENGNSLFGTYATTGKQFNVTGGSATGKKFYFFNNSAQGFSVPTAGFYKYTLGEYFMIDDVQLYHNDVSEYIASDCNLAIFARTTNTASTTFADKIIGKMKYLYVKESGTMLYYLIACYRKADSKIGMYDIVNDVFYTNAGIGAFTKGADVN